MFFPEEFYNDNMASEILDILGDREMDENEKIELLMEQFAGEVDAEDLEKLVYDATRRGIVTIEGERFKVA